MHKESTRACSEELQESFDVMEEYPMCLRKFLGKHANFGRQRWSQEFSLKGVLKSCNKRT